MFTKLYVLCLVLLAASLGCTRMQRPQSNFMLAYSEVETEQEGLIAPVVHDQGGVMFGIGFDGAVGEVAPNGGSFRLGGRLLTSWYHEDISERIVAGEPGLTIEEFAEMMLFTPQMTASYRQVFGSAKKGLFIEPGAGLGLSIGSIFFGSEFQFGDDPIGVDYGDDEWAFGVALNPFVRGGVVFDRVLVGVEGGYQWSTAEFDSPLGADPSEWYVGGFVALELGPPSQ